jgi:hypothetical protein
VDCACRPCGVEWKRLQSLDGAYDVVQLSNIGINNEVLILTMSHPLLGGVCVQTISSFFFLSPPQFQSISLHILKATIQFISHSNLVLIIFIVIFLILNNS